MRERERERALKEPFLISQEKDGHLYRESKKEQFEKQ